MIGRIKKIRWGAPSADDIRRGSTAVITTNKLHGPPAGTFYDPKLGPYLINQVCGRCGNTAEKCTGHFGMIELPAPVLNPTYTEWVLRILRVICYECGEPVKMIDTSCVPPLERLKYWATKTSDIAFRKCDTCGFCAPKFSRYKGTKTSHRNFIAVKFKDDEAGEVSARDIYDTLSLCTANYQEQMGLNFAESHPRDWMFFDGLPVPGTFWRPSNSSGVRGEDLTARLRSIFAAVKSCAEKPNDFGVYLEMADQIALFIDSNSLGAKTGRSFGPSRESLTTRINGPGSKESIFRKIISGKRVEKSARAVIAPDNSLCFDEIGVPQVVCNILTKRVVVNSVNYADMLEAVRLGPNHPRGANSVTRGDDHIDLSAANRNALELNFGDAVERHLRDGDIVLMNRAPSLHKWSVMAHRVRMVERENYTFRMHPAACKCYNADFDGDEMTMVVPETVGAEAEARNIMSVRENILKNGSAIVSIVQHSLVMAYAISEEVRLEPNIVYYLIGVYAPMSGREVVSHILPPNIHVSLPNLQIVDGKWVGGRLSSGSLNCNGGLMVTIVTEYGYKAAAEFIDRANTVFQKYLHVRRGFSFTINDCKSDGENLQMMIESGAKGKKSHVAMFSGSLGPVCSALPKEYMPNHSGVIESNYSAGLSMADEIAVQAGNGPGLAASAAVVPRTGVAYRSVAYMTSPVHIAYDWTVRLLNGRVLYTTYADGFDANVCVRNPLRVPERFSCEREREVYLQSQLPHSHIDLHDDWDRFFMAPVLISNLVLKHTRGNISTLTPDELLEKREAFLRGLPPMCPKFLWGVRGVLTCEALRGCEPELFADLERCICRGMAEPGENVGLAAAQDMGESTTQMSLNDFREKSSVSSDGLPRLEALVSVANKIGKYNVTLRLHDPITPEVFSELYKEFHEIRLAKVIERFESNEESGELELFFNRQKCIKCALFPSEIAVVLSDESEIVSASMRSDEIYSVRLRPDMELITPAVARDCDQVINGESVIKLLRPIYPDADFEFRGKSVTVSINTIPDDTRLVSDVIAKIDDIPFLELETTYKVVADGATIYNSKTAKNMQMCQLGSDAVLSIKVTYEPEQANSLWIESGEGRLKYALNLYGKRLYSRIIRGLEGARFIRPVLGDKVLVVECSRSGIYPNIFAHPLVDERRSTCESPVEVLSIYGIAATRSCLHRSFASVFKYGPHDPGYRHSKILAGVMTCTGTIESAVYKGIRSLYGDSGPTYVASFERPTATYAQAGARGSVDDCKSLIQCIYVSSNSATGTGIVNTVAPPFTPHFVLPDAICAPLAGPHAVTLENLLTPSRKRRTRVEPDGSPSVAYRSVMRVFTAYQNHSAY